MIPPVNNILKADAAAKSGNDTRVGTSGLERRRLESWGQAQQSAVEQCELGVKTAKQLVARQPWKEGTEAGREVADRIRGNQGRRQPTTPRHKRRERNKRLLGYFFVVGNNTRSA